MGAPPSVVNMSIRACSPAREDARPQARPARKLPFTRRLGGRRGHFRASTSDRRIVHHHAAGAAVLYHAAEASAASLNHLTALAVAGRVRDADALVGHL